jgi:ankyrin repeat protein
VNAVDEYQQSALSSAVRACDASAVRFLLDRGSKLDRELEWFSGCADTDIAVAAELVRAHRDQHVPLPADALVSAADRPTAPFLRLFLDAGMDVDARGRDGVTPAMRAAERGRHNTLQLLLSVGANPNAVDASGRRALQIAATSYNTAGVTLLAKYGAKLDATDRSGQTALIQAAANCRFWIVEALLAAGADPTIKDSQGRTARDVGLPPTHGDFDKCRPTQDRLSKARQ